MDAWTTHLDFEELFYLLPHFFEVVHDLPPDFFHRGGIAPQHPLVSQVSKYDGDGTAYSAFVVR